MSNDQKEYKKLTSYPEAISILSDLAKAGMSDKQIQEELHKQFKYKWNIGTIRRQRKNIVDRTSGIDNQKFIKKPSLSNPPPGLSENQKADWFREQFKKSHLFSALKSQLTPEEIKIYIEEYGSLCCQFEDIVLSEFFQVDDFLKHRVLINRQLIIMRQMQERIEELSSWLFEHPLTDDFTKEQKDLRRETNRLLNDCEKDLNRANDRYDKLSGERQKIYNNLAATRKDRVEELRGGKENFFHLVSSLQSLEDERAAQGKYAELTKMAADDITKELSKPKEFPDGEIDSVIIDATMGVED